MNIAIIDADIINKSKHRFPNLACMKLSGYYKSLGHTVFLLLNYNCIPKFDRVFISKVFTDTVVPVHILSLPNVEYNGTGFNYDDAKPLPYNIEHHMPDYNLYDNWISIKVDSGIKLSEFRFYTDYSIGFTTRGCFRGCWFCVNRNCKQSIKHSAVDEFLDVNRKYILLLDDNVLACKDWKRCFDELITTGKPFQYKQGLDERILTEDKCDYIFNKSKWHGNYIFAFDNYEDKEIIISKLKLIHRVRSNHKKRLRFYVFCGGKNPKRQYNNFWEQDIRETFERCKILGQYNCFPYIMRHSDYLNAPEPYLGIYKNIATWCNQPNFFYKMSFREFSMLAGMPRSIYKKYIGKYNEYIADGHKKYATWKYMENFEAMHPNIAEEYFDLKMFSTIKSE